MTNKKTITIIKKNLKKIFGLETSPVLCGAFLFLLFLLIIKPNTTNNNNLSLALYSQDNKLLTAYVSKDGQWRFDFDTKNKLSEKFTTALLTYEDKRFYGHTGFDVLAIANAFSNNVKSKKIVRGASTITMQVARLSKKASNRTVVEKIKELGLSISLELFYTKEQLLNMYAILAPFGGNVVGIEAACNRWFGVSNDKLTWAEASTLAILPNSPSLVYLEKSRNILQEKRDALLNKLYNKKKITEAEYKNALIERLPNKALAMPHILNNLVPKNYSGRVVTTIDYDLQKKANEIASMYAKKIAANKIGNLAAIIMKIEDSSIVSYIGNVPFDIGQTNNDKINENSLWVDCARAKRSSGSILKPFLFASMIDTGELSPQRILYDIPTRIGSYSPENNLNTYAGVIPANEALTKSLNIPFVRLLRTFGVERFQNVLNKIGFTSINRNADDYGLTLILGGAETTLLEASVAYSAIARIAQSKEKSEIIQNKNNINDKQFVGYKYIKEDNSHIHNYEPPFSPGAAYLTLEALCDVTRPQEEMAWKNFVSSRKIAWKTGTSFGYKDAWAIGMNGEYVVAVWVGNADGIGRPELKGTAMASPLMFNLFQILPRAKWFKKPSYDLKFETICADSGYIAGANCINTKRIEIPKNAKTDEVCPFCKAITLTKDRKYRTSIEESGSKSVVIEKRFCLPAAVEYYYTRNSTKYKTLPDWEPGTKAAEQSAMDFISPEEGINIFIPIEIDGTLGQTIFHAVHRTEGAKLFWHLDGEYIGQTEGEHKIAYRPLPGNHELVIVDEKGVTKSVKFYVYNRE